VLTNGTANAVSTDQNGSFAATLQTALKSGSFVWITQVATPAGGGASIPLFSIVQTVGALAKLPTIQQPVKDQQNPIVGTATASATGVPVQVQLYVKASGSDSTYSPQGAAENVGMDGTYTLHETVTLGEFIYVKQLGGAGEGASSESVIVQALDNEREHIDFFAGTLISESESNFAQADTFLALNVDRALILPGFYPVPTAAINKSHHPGVNTFFQARLTTIPVNASTTTTTATVPSNATGTVAPSLSSVLTSQKTGHFEAGLYLPFTFGRVPLQAPKSPTQTFYIAPLGRFGFNTLAGSSQSTTTTSSTTVTTTTTTALGTTNPLPSTYNFFVGGLRLGTAAIEPGSLHNIHYLDVAIGKFSNLENLLCKAGANQCSNLTMENRYRPYRLSFEGYYQLPITGFILGLSANVGPGFFDHRTNTDVQNRAPSDLRFLFGYKFDVVKLFKAMPMITQ
jgi:hypothetical protein